jgi:hypothetical protein
LARSVQTDLTGQESSVPSYSAVGLLGTANPTFSTNVTDLDIAWIGGNPV